MVDDVGGNGLIKYCKAKGITFKEYPKCLKDSTSTVNVNPMVHRRKKIPPKSNDNAVSDHETSTSCSEGEDDVAYIKAVKSFICAADPDQKKTTTATATATLSSSSSSSTISSVPQATITDTPVVTLSQ